MTIVFEHLGFNSPENQFWVEHRGRGDPLDLNYIAAAEELVQEGHQCHVTMCIQEEITKKLNGVTYNLFTDAFKGLAFIQQLKPDKIVCSSTLNHYLIEQYHKICPSVWNIFHTDPQLFPPVPDCMKQVTASLPYQVAALRCRYPKIRVEWYAMGVNIPLITAYNKPTKEWDMIFGAPCEFKGLSKCTELFSILGERGYRIPANAITGRLPRDEYLKLAGSTLYYFYPSIIDGAARSLMECSIAGCRPIVSMQSPPSLGLAPYIDPIFIDGMACASLTENLCTFDRSTLSIADELEQIIKSQRKPYKHKLESMYSLKHKEIIKKLLLE